MRLKEFLIFIAGFTVLYITFFVIYDAIQRKRENGRVNNRFQNVMDGERFFRFAQFYGVGTRLSSEQLNAIYESLKNAGEYSISIYAKQLQISPYEMIVIILYFEYFLLLDKKAISMKEDIVRHMNATDQGYLFKYGPYFIDKKPIEQIKAQLGEGSLKELEYIQEYFLYPGVRLWDSKIYYVEGVDFHA